MKWLALAECLENRGRFLPDLNAVIRSFCQMRTWVYPAHDRDLVNFKGEQIDIDLFSSQLASELATINYILGDRLDEDVRRLISENIRTRILVPFEDMANRKRPQNFWFSITNNWNAVCLARVTIAALTMLDSPSERAFYIAAAEHYSKNFLRGFTEDGYCTEGIGYWIYGFGHYALLAETISQATSGGVELLDLPNALRPARYGFAIEIMEGLYPPFSDCGLTASPMPLMMDYLSRRLGFGYAKWEKARARKIDTTLCLCYFSMFYFNNTASSRPAAENPILGLEPRTWFDQAGVLICRPGTSESCRLGVALKGGHNDEHHNHNDVGSYVVAVGKEILLIDPGTEQYTARTFSAQRYESNLLNSYGHPVPVVAGKLQQTGREARGRVVHTEFTDDVDTITFDLSSAYDVPELKKLERTFVYSREGNGSLIVIDEVAFSEEQSFETALITTQRHELLDDGSIRISGKRESARINIVVEGSNYDIQAETIEKDVRTPPRPTRLGIRLARPVTQAKVTVQVVP